MILGKFYCLYFQPHFRGLKQKRLLKKVFKQEATFFPIYSECFVTKKSHRKKSMVEKK